jgi:hypothetical protein
MHQTNVKQLDKERTLAKEANTSYDKAEEK